MQIRSILLCASLSLLAAACGGAAEQTSASGPPAAQSSEGDRGPAPGSSTSTGETDPPAAASPSVGSVKIVVQNRSANDVWLLRDYQAPLWLEIDGGLQLNGYGQQWCDQDPPSHNDPFWMLQKVAAGVPYEQTWDGHRVSFESGCWKKLPVAAGPHTARACVYDADVDLERSNEPIPAGPSAPVPPSKWFSPAPSRCVDFSFDLPATGSITVDVDL